MLSDCRAHANTAAAPTLFARDPLQLRLFLLMGRVVDSLTNGAL